MSDLTATQLLATLEAEHRRLTRIHEKREWVIEVHPLKVAGYKMGWLAHLVWRGSEYDTKHFPALAPLYETLKQRGADSFIQVKEHKDSTHCAVCARKR